MIATLAEQARRRGHRRDGRDRRPRPVPAGRAGACGSWPPAAGSPTRRSTTARPWSSATASRPSWSPTSSGSRATPRTTSPASRASATRRPRSCSRSGATSRACSANIDVDLGRQAQGEPARARRRRAHLEAARDRACATSTSDVDFDQVIAARARPLAPARDVPGVRAARPAASASRRRSARTAPRRPSAWTRWSRCRARGAAGRARRAGGELVAIAALRPGEDPDEAAAPRRGSRGGARAEEDAAWRPWRRRSRAVEADGPAQGSFDFDGGPRGPLTVAAWAGDEVLVGEAETLAAFSMARGERPVVAHDWKTIAMADDACAAPPLEHDTMVAAYLIDPARRGYPLDELAERGRAIEARASTGVATAVARGARRAHAPAGGAPARAARRGRADATCFHEIELPLVDVLVEMERAGRQARRRAAARDQRALSTSARGARAARLGAGRRGVHDRLAAAARADPVREARPVAQAPRQDRLLDRRARAAGDPRTSTRSSRRSRSGASSRSSRAPTSTPSRS